MWRSGTAPSTSWRRSRPRACPPTTRSCGARPPSQGMTGPTRRVSARRLPRTSRRWRSIRPLSRPGRSSRGRRQRCTSVARPHPAVAEAARRAAERALALGPTRPEGHQALGAYYAHVLGDHSRAYTEDSTALALAPGNAELLGSCGLRRTHSRPLGGGARALGAGCPARSPLRHSRPVRSGCCCSAPASYPEAERALDHALQLAPANLDMRR